MFIISCTAYKLRVAYTFNILWRMVGWCHTRTVGTGSDTNVGSEGGTLAIREASHLATAQESSPDKNVGSESWEASHLVFTQECSVRLEISIWLGIERDVMESHQSSCSVHPYRQSRVRTNQDAPGLGCSLTGSQSAPTEISQDIHHRRAKWTHF